jgi:hypothetical protein
MRFILLESWKSGTVIGKKTGNSRAVGGADNGTEQHSGKVTGNITEEYAPLCAECQ